VINAEKTVPIPAPTPAKAIVDKPAPTNLAACKIIKKKKERKSKKK
jgi:hypothetical protein